MHLSKNRGHGQIFSFLLLLFLKSQLSESCNNSTWNCNQTDVDSSSSKSDLILSSSQNLTTEVFIASTKKTTRLSQVIIESLLNIRFTTRTTSRPRPFSTTESPTDFDSFGENLKLSAIVLAAIALGLGILRVCMMLCKSRRNNQRRMRATALRSHSNVNRHTVFKPDLPPAYAEAVGESNFYQNKLPTYDELSPEQRGPYTIAMENEPSTTRF